MIRQALDVLFSPGQVIEVRALRVDGKKNNTASGYFDDFDLAAAAAEKFEMRCSGVYVTLNEVDPALLSRRHNRIETYADLTTSDHDIIRRRWLPVDFDAVRPAGVSATDAEHLAALECAQRALVELRAEGWPEPVVGDSGNGAHLLYPIDLPNDAESLAVIEKTLEALSERFGNDTVKVDRKNANAARIWKCYGTLARKGDSTPERPHRRSRLIEVNA